MVSNDLITCMQVKTLSLLFTGDLVSFDPWHILLQSENDFELRDITAHFDDANYLIAIKIERIEFELGFDRL